MVARAEVGSDMAAKILIVEDDPSHLQLLTCVLKNGGYEVVRAYGGEDALKRAQTQPIDLIVTDLAMPRMSGIDLIARLEDDDGTRDIPIIAVSAHVPLGRGFLGRILSWMCSGWEQAPALTSERAGVRLQPRRRNKLASTTCIARERVSF